MLSWLSLFASVLGFAASVPDCRVDAEPSWVKPGQSYTLRWKATPEGTGSVPTPPKLSITEASGDPVHSGKLSIEAVGSTVAGARVAAPAKKPDALPVDSGIALCDSKSFPCVAVPAEGERRVTPTEPGSDRWGISVKGTHGGYHSNCSFTVRVGDPPAYSGGSIALLKARKSNEQGLNRTSVEVRLRAFGADCTGPFALEFGDGLTDNVGGMKPVEQGACGTDFQVSFINGRGSFTVVLYKGVAADKKKIPIAAAVLTIP